MSLRRMPAYALQLGANTAPAYECALCHTTTVFDGWAVVPDYPLAVAALEAMGNPPVKAAYYCNAPACEEAARAHAVELFLNYTGRAP